jgi:c-di-GMP-binding flagellar brake protein YcgR
VIKKRILNDDSELRKFPRYRLHLHVAIVYENKGQSEIFHGRTHDVSLSGASVYSDHNIFVTEPIKVLLAIPSPSSNQSTRLVEIHTKMAYTVMPANHNKFRIGLNFLRFKADGRSILQEYLSNRTPLG